MKNHKFTLGIGKANMYSLILMIPLIVIYLMVFISVWGNEKLNVLEEHNVGVLIITAVIGIAFHEIIHGLTWIILTQNRISSLKFGFSWKFMTPFCHYRKSIKVRFYRVGIVMPLIILGILPSVIALVTGNGFLYLWGIFFTCIATGDIIVLFMLRKLSAEEYVFDHSKKMGFKIEKEEET